ncbi:glycosyl hydrolase family 18 protein [Deinococcus sp.]|uniref:glycoside hydrolase family 18 protein n=1 Tax=Deinococcus sp. TaxID=47478 RepID=UPI003CC674DB
MKATAPIRLFLSLVVLSAQMAAGQMAAAQTSSDRLLFYNATTGSGVTGRLDASGTFTTLNSYGNFSKGWTTAVSTLSGIFFYNGLSGTSGLGTIDTAGNFQNVNNERNFSKGWTQVVSTPNGLLFYNAITGSGATGRLDASGSFTTLRTYNNFSKGWTQVVSTPNGLLFYNGFSGTSALGTIDAAGNFQTLKTYSNFSKGWTQVVSTPNGLLFYNGFSGTSALGTIDAAGNFQTLKTYSNFSKGWTQVVSTPNGLLFYNATTGSGATGRLDASGSFTTLKTYNNFSKGWTLIVAASEVTTPTTPAAAGPWVMGYVAGYERDLLQAAELHWASLTHLAVSRAVPRPDGTLDTSFDIGAQGPAWAASMVAQAHAHGVKAMLMLGGEGAEAGFREAASAAQRSAFVQNILALVNSSGFDGVDLDWEPLTAADEPALLALAQALKAQKPGLLLTLPLGYVNANFPAELARPSLAALAGAFDRINIMTYGMANAAPGSGWFAWHSSALSGATPATPSSVQDSVQAYLAAGIPAAKLGVGIGFFGLCYQGVSGPGQQSASMKIVASDGTMSYNNILNSYATPATRRWDAAAQVPYLSSPSPLGSERCNYVSYEDEASVALKGSYARAQGLGGVIIWTLGQGHLPGRPAMMADPLLDAVYKAFASRP